jgi:hypothetical protein
MNYDLGHFQIPRNPLQATNSYAPRQVQLGLKMIFKSRPVKRNS